MHKYQNITESTRLSISSTPYFIAWYLASPDPIFWFQPFIRLPTEARSCVIPSMVEFVFIALSLSWDQELLVVHASSTVAGQTLIRLGIRLTYISSVTINTLPCPPIYKPPHLQSLYSLLFQQINFSLHSHPTHKRWGFPNLRYRVQVHLRQGSICYSISDYGAQEQR